LKFTPPVSSKRVVDRALANPADLGNGKGVVTDFPELPKSIGELVAGIVERLK